MAAAQRAPHDLRLAAAILLLRARALTSLSRNGYGPWRRQERFWGGTPQTRESGGRGQVPAPPAGDNQLEATDFDTCLESRKFCILVFGCFDQVFGQSWPQDPFKRVKLEKWCRTRPILAPETNSRDPRHFRGICSNAVKMIFMFVWGG